MYLLTRDDGAILRVSGGLWESALEFAYLYGWRPAGTEAPRTEGWREGRSAWAAGGAWDRQDYFSHASQHVRPHDARAVANALLRALVEVPAEAGPRAAAAATDAPASASPVPTRASVTGEGLSVQRRRSMRRIAAFAGRGGFTIDEA